MLQVGVHVDPDARVVGQLPMPPLFCAVRPVHGLGEHDCSVAVPAEHVVVAELTVYPELHGVEHVAPDAIVPLLHDPIAPFVGATMPVHGFALQFCAVNAPARHDVGDASTV